MPTLTTSYAHGTSSYSLLNATVGDTLTRAADAWPDREAAVFVRDGVRKTFASFHQDVSARARAPTCRLAAVFERILTTEAQKSQKLNAKRQNDITLFCNVMGMFVCFF